MRAAQKVRPIVMRPHSIQTDITKVSWPFSHLLGSRVFFRAACGPGQLQPPPPHQRARTRREKDRSITNLTSRRWRLQCLNNGGRRRRASPAETGLSLQCCHMLRSASLDVLQVHASAHARTRLVLLCLLLRGTFKRSRCVGWQGTTACASTATLITLHLPQRS